MAYTKYSLTPGNNTAAPPDGAPEGMLPSAVNDTMRDMMAQIRDCGDGIRGGTYTMTAPVITGGSVTGVTAVSTSGNLTFTGTGNRITGDFSNATLASRVAFQTSTTNGVTVVSSIPNGTGTQANFNVFNNSDPTNASDFRFLINSTEARLQAGIAGTGTYLPITMYTGGIERLRIETSGNVLIGKTATSSTVSGFQTSNGGSINFECSVVNARTDAAGIPFLINREGSDGTLIGFYQANTIEGSISVSGTTVSYNGGHLSRYAQTTTAKDETLLKGTVLSNLNEMNTYVDADGNQVDNEQLNKVKVSDVEGDVNVAGVFVNWSHDEQHNVDEINMAMTGDMIIRIAQGVVVQKGDLLMSAGDGTAKPQGDDIVRSKTIAKVTSNYVTCTYADGSYCVPCVLMAC
jgi:hypothetical protein